MPHRRPNIYFHLHLVSDATGETVNAVAKAACAQFESARPIEHVHPLVRTPKQVNRLLQEIADAPGVVLCTIMNPDLRRQLETGCAELQIPYIPVLDTVLGAFGNYLGTETTHLPGGQHAMDAAYFDRIEALTFTITHDDGQRVHDLEGADVVLVGISRTSKTPTCIYLAHRGLKAANVPIVPGCPLPPELERLEKPLVVGLTASPERLVEIRGNRMQSLNQHDETLYTDRKAVRDEVALARRIFRGHGWPTIDVTRRAIEETAAAIFALYSRRMEAQPAALDILAEG
jgi:hypothetical protein